jgi:hypothetical protein
MFLLFLDLIKAIKKHTWKRWLNRVAKMSPSNIILLLAYLQKSFGVLST